MEGVPALAAVVLIIALLVLSTRYLDRQAAKPTSSEEAKPAASPKQSRAEAKQAAREKKVVRDEKPAGAPACTDLDIEDLSKSLVPETLRRMKKDGVKPYTLGDS